MKDALDTEDEIIPFSGQDDRRPMRARKAMQLQDVDAALRDMRYAFAYAPNSGKLLLWRSASQPSLV